MSSIRPNVLRMRPYSPGKPIEEVKRELGLERVIKLASNENPLGPSPMAIAATKQAAESMHLYPDGAAFEFRTAVSKKFNVPLGNVIFGNGSDELLHLLGLILLGSPEDEVVVGYPSFVRYDAAAHLAPAVLKQVPLDREFRHDLRAMAAAVTENTKLVFVANPNNPTGTVVRRSEVEAFIRDLPSSATLVLDEAYFEFAAHLGDFPLSSEYVIEGKNVVGLRTLSKIYGLAGIRIGYGFAPDWIVDAIDRAREPFNMNSLAQAAGAAALSDEDHLKATLENNAKGVRRLSDCLRSLGAHVGDSYANFIWADFGRPTRRIFEALLRRGIIVRPGDVLGNPNCLRVSVGTEEEMEIFEAEMREVMAEAVTP